MENTSEDSVNSRQVLHEPPPALVTSTFSEPWHKRIRGLLLKNPNITPFLGIGLFLLIGLLITAATTRHSQDVRTKAVTHTAKVFIIPNTTSLSTNSILQIWATTDSPLSYANVEVIFDPQVIKLIQEVIPATTTWSRIIQLTTIAEANISGKLTMVVGLDPLYIQNPPSGTFQLSTLKFGANTTTPNITTTIGVSSTSAQLVASDTTMFTLTTTESTITVNPLATPTTTPIQPTDTPYTPTMNPINDVTPPTVTVTTPVDGFIMPKRGNVSIKVTSSDTSGIASITIAVDNSIEKTCTKVTSCQLNFSVAKIKNGSHTITAKATDNSINNNTASSTIYVTK